MVRITWSGVMTRAANYETQSAIGIINWFSLKHNFIGYLISSLHYRSFHLISVTVIFGIKFTRHQNIPHKSHRRSILVPVFLGECSWSRIIITKGMRQSPCFIKFIYYSQCSACVFRSLFIGIFSPFFFHFKIFPMPRPRKCVRHKKMRYARIEFEFE